MRSQSGDSVCDGDANDAVGHPALLCKRGLYCHGGSVTFVHSVKKNKDIFEVFSLSGSPTNPTILVLQYQTSRQYSDGNPPPSSRQRGCRMQVGQAEITILSLYLAISGFIWRGGLVVGRRTCDLVVAGSRPGRDAAA